MGNKLVIFHLKKHFNILFLFAVFLRMSCKDIEKDYQEDNCIVMSSKDIPCTKEYNPVCGCNQITFGNECVARASDVPVFLKGAYSL